MSRYLDFRSYSNFLGRNRLYTAINLFGLGISLMFVLLIADFTLRQFTTDDYHSKADRIYAIGTERDINSGYYLQKHLRERYPEIESTCAVAGSGGVQAVEAGQRKFSATILFVDSTFFRFFDFPLMKGDRAEALGARDNVVLSESFARKVFADFDPVGQTIHFPDEEKSYVVSGVVRDIDRSIFPNSDILMRAERLCDINPANDERMSNCGAVTTFLMAKPGADLGTKIPDMVSYFKEIYWPYRGNVVGEVSLTPLHEVYFSPLNTNYTLHRGSWPFVMILFGVGAVILVFAVMNYVNLTVAQTGFRAKEMAARRLMGATRGGIVCKLILESTLFCAAAFAVALFLAVAVEPYAERVLESKLDILGDVTPLTAFCYLLFTLLLGVVSGIVPALRVARCQPIDIVRGQFRFRSKMRYGKVLITLQNAITICLVATSLVIGLQIRHLISAPLGYHTKDILDISTDIFDSYAEIRVFREELGRLPCVEAVAMSCGTPHDRGNNNTVQRGPDEMVSFQTFIGDSVYFRILGLERLHDNCETDPDDEWFVDQYTLRVLDIDESTPEVKLGEDYSWGIHVAGVYRDFQVGSALDAPTAVLLRDVGDFDKWWVPTRGFEGRYPWNLLVKITGDPAEAYRAIRETFERVTDGDVFSNVQYIEQQIEEDYAEQRRVLTIVGIFTLIALLISALGLVAMSTYYIQQKQQEIAVRKVFGSTRGEVLRRLTGSFMRLIGAAFAVACPVTWYLMSRWLEEHAIRISLSPLVFLVAGLFVAAVALAAVVFQSWRAADANPVGAIKS